MLHEQQENFSSHSYLNGNILLTERTASYPCSLFLSPPVLGHPVNLTSKGLQLVLTVVLAFWWWLFKMRAFSTASLLNKVFFSLDAEVRAAQEGSSGP